MLQDFQIFEDFSILIERLTTTPMIRTRALQVAKGLLYDEGKSKERKDISIKNFSRSRFQRKKGWVQGFFFRVGRVSRTTEFFLA